MKIKLLITVITLIIFNDSIFSQGSTDKPSIPKNSSSVSKSRDTAAGNSYYFLAPAHLIRVVKDLENKLQTQPIEDVLPKNNTTNELVSQVNDIFTVVSLTGDSAYYILKLWRFKTNHKNANAKIQYYYGRDTAQDDGIFLIGIDQFNKNCKRFIPHNKWNWNIGSMIYPFKWRPQTGVFEQSANIGLIFGTSGKIRYSKTWTWGIYGGASETSNTLDSATTNGTEKKTTTITTFSPSLNGILCWNNSLQITVGMGYDFVVGEHTTATDSWIYKNKPWVGLGIGLNIFSTSTPKTGNSTGATPPANL